MAKRRLSRGLRKRLRQEKARIRRAFADSAKQLEEIERIRQAVAHPLTPQGQRAIENLPMKAP